jgi:hypothetical protein
MYHNETYDEYLYKQYLYLIHDDSAQQLNACDENRIEKSNSLAYDPEINDEYLYKKYLDLIHDDPTQ